ncbi:AMP-binding protein [Streptomyces sp. JL4002]|uniref:AMP-binding protein n=1 Tax=Streptomyces TaxID=1883 RepID=UPI003B281431
MHTDDAPGPPPSLVRALLRAVRRDPRAVAVVDGAAAHTYAELDRLSAEIAGGLAARGLGPDDVLAVHGERSWERCAAVLGAWRAGLGVVCVDPGMPAPRAARIARHCALLVRSDASAPAGLGPAEATLGEVRGAPLEEIREGSVGYVIPTSGSTGEPKSVAVPPSVLAALGDWHVRHWSHDRPPHTLQAASIGFDVGYEEIVATWLAGAALVVVSDEERQDPFTLMEVVRAHRVARLFLPVVGLHALATAAVFEPDAMPDLREIAVAGERLVVNAEVREFCAAAGVALVNEYGPSETHVVTQHRLDPRGAASWPEHPPIGTAVAGAELLREAGGVLRPFAPGEEAELIVAGGSVGLGYLGDPELTAARFRTLPHADGAPRRCYATGDLVRFDGESFHFVARADDQLKVAGYRVEPGEVEAVLGTVPGVRRAVVVAVEVAGSRRLAAVWTRAGSGGPGPEDLAAACAARLPAYMVPRHFHRLDELPVTANGKVDRAALRTLFAPARAAA